MYFEEDEADEDASSGDSDEPDEAFARRLCPAVRPVLQQHALGHCVLTRPQLASDRVEELTAMLQTMRSCAPAAAARGAP